MNSFEKMSLSFDSKLKSALSLVFALSLLIANSGCGAIVPRSMLYPNFFDGGAARVAAEAVKAKFGEKARVLEVEIGKDFTLKVQDATNPQNVDAYKYAAGFFIKTGAVRLDGLERNLKSTLFDFAEIDLSNIGRLAAQINERAKLENGGIRKIEIGRALSLAGGFENSGSVRWLVEFGNERESLTAIADARGNLRGVDLSQTRQADEFDLKEPIEFARMVDTLHETFGEREMIADIKIYDQSLYIHKPKPTGDEPETIYEYVYDVSGFREKPGLPTTSSPKDQFEFGEINLTDAPRLAKRALEELGAPPDAFVSLIEIKRVNDMGKDYRTIWVIDVKPKRNSSKLGFVHFDAQGNFIKAVKW